MIRFIVHGEIRTSPFRSRHTFLSYSPPFNQTKNNNNNNKLRDGGRARHIDLLWGENWCTYNLFQPSHILPSHLRAISLRATFFYLSYYILTISRSAFTLPITRYFPFFTNQPVIPALSPMKGNFRGLK